MQIERKKKSKCKLSKSEITQLYTEGKSTSEIATLANVSARYIRMVLTDNNVPRRAIGSWKRKYDISEDYFKTWSNNMAYILGFIAADGVIQKENQCVSISQKESYILEDIKQELNTKQPLYQNKKTGVYMLNINSKTIKDDLMNIHGIMPCKSLNIKFPFVPEEYLHHFVRGYFDGDGYVKYETYTVSFVGGSYTFMNSLHQILQNQNLSADLLNQNKHHRVILTGRKSIQLFSNWIYTDKDIYLYRKYEEFQKESLSLDQLKDRKLKRTQAAVKQRKQNFLKEYMKNKCIATSCYNLEIKELTLITSDNETFEEYFQNTNTDINYKKMQLVKGFVAADRQIDLHLNIVYEKLGLYQNSQPVIPVFRSTDLSILNEIANTISKDLVLLFKENDKPLKEYFVSSGYSKEITYEEFFIWWYHFFYTKVTEELIKQGVIRISSHKNQIYNLLNLTFI